MLMSEYIEKNYNDLVKYCKSMYKEQALDILHSVYVKVLLNKATVDHTKNVKSYVHTALTNRFINGERDSFWKKKLSIFDTEKLEEYDFNEDVFIDYNTSDDLMSRYQTVQKLRTEIEKLHPRQREIIKDVIHLEYEGRKTVLHGKKRRRNDESEPNFLLEIAKRKNMNQFTVRTHYRLGRLNLKKMLEGQA
jgi:RNA polymerase sigma factor (sigma-70 family)